MKIQHILDQKWEFRLAADQESPQADITPQKWYPATIPGTVHTDLLNADLIPDPFYGKNEIDLQWIGQRDWEYQTQFDFPSEMETEKTTYLIFKGLDTFAHIYLNGELIGKTENMFINYRFTVTDRLKEKNNVLKIVFKSALNTARKLIDEHGELFSARWPERSYARKAQYSFGWDWGPAFPTAGMWKPLYLEQNTGITIEACGISTFELSSKEAKLLIDLELAGRAVLAETIEIELSNKKHMVKERFPLDNQLMFRNQITVPNPDLWWPRGYGEQNLYNLKVTLLDISENILDQCQRKTGIRTIELDLGDEDNRAYRFMVNNKPVYAKGANWIPCDSFLPRISDDTYERLVTDAANANMNMLRVWGGGIYEQDIFYELCDSLGIMVWQDFMFACATYWEDPDHLASIGIEVKQNIQRLQHHPSIALWCGNNENEWIWYRSGLGPYTEMPGFRIFHEILPDLVQTYDPFRTYWPTSPFGEDEDPNSEFTGNRHSWDIWSRWVDYTDVDEDRSLFVTEFGFQGPANVDTLNAVIPDDQRSPQSEIFEFHNKQTEGNERLFRFLAAHLPVKMKWDEFIYLTQLNQGLALKTCLEHWRHRWPETSGSIIWQMNDCWPVTSWSLVDSELSAKLAYFFVKNAFADSHIQIQHDSEGINLHLAHDVELDLADHAVIQIIDAETGKVKLDLNLPVDNATHLYNLFSDDELPESGKWIIVADLYDEDDNRLCRNYYSDFPWKYMNLKPAKIEIKKKEDSLILTSNAPAYFVDLYHPQASFSDKGFILLANENYAVNFEMRGAEKLDLSKIKVVSLNEYLK
jgi:beta-mannosidase